MIRLLLAALCAVVLASSAEPTWLSGMWMVMDEIGP